MKRILAVVVTYNRKDLLQRCLGALAAQTRPCDDIVVVDNGSTDGTSEMLAQAWGQRVQTHVLSPNIGSAGGYSAGVRIAYAQKADFIWLMDDDVIPEPDALEKLIDADRLLESRGIARAFVCSTPWTPEGEVTNVPGIDTRRNRIHYRNWPFLLEHRMMPVNRSTFVSFLLPREVVTEHGLPLAPMFIWGEDTEYTTRITRRCPGYIVGDSKVVHVRSLSGLLSIRTETHPVRIGYHRHHVRNHLYIARRYEGRGKFMRKLWIKSRLMVRLLLEGDVHKAGVVGRGMVEGLFFDPTIEAADASTQALGVKVTRIAPHGSARPLGTESPLAA